MYKFYKESTKEGLISSGLQDRISDTGSFTEFTKSGSSVHNDFNETITSVKKTNNFFIFSVSFISLAVFLYFILYLFS